MKDTNNVHKELYDVRLNYGDSCTIADLNS